MVDSNQRVVSRKRGQYGAGLVVLSLQKKWWRLREKFSANSFLFKELQNDSDTQNKHQKNQRISIRLLFLKHM